jgi:hypothetical protein
MYEIWLTFLLPNSLRLELLQQIRQLHQIRYPKPRPPASDRHIWIRRNHIAPAYRNAENGFVRQLQNDPLLTPERLPYYEPERSTSQRMEGVNDVHRYCIARMKCTRRLWASGGYRCSSGRGSCGQDLTGCIRSMR